MATQTTQTQVIIPEYIEKPTEILANELLAQAQQPLTVPQQQVIGFSPTQQSAMNLAFQGIGSYQPFLDAAQAAQTAGLGTIGAGAQTVAGAQFVPTEATLDRFRDPYQRFVTDEAIKEIDRQAAMAQNQLAGQAVKAGAFGGSRFGIQQSELARNAADLKSRRVFEDLSRNFQQAQAAKNAANQQMMQQGQVFGQLANQQGVIGGNIAGLGGQQQQLGMGDVQSLMGIGSLQQQLGQNILNTNTANLAAQQALPFNTASFASNILAQQAPFGGSQTQTISPFAQPNPYAQAFGAIGSLTGQGGLGSLIG